MSHEQQKTTQSVHKFGKIESGNHNGNYNDSYETFNLDWKIGETSKTSPSTPLYLPSVWKNANSGMVHTAT